MKKILIITYYWPPSGGAEVQRWLKFVKYLVKFGYKPHVYTPENPELPAIDKSLQADVPDQAVIVKRKIFEPYSFYKKFTGKSGNVNASFLSEDKDSRKKLTEKISVWIRGNLFIPDARVFWVNPSYRFLKNYIQEKNIDIVISTGPPHSMHLIAKKLKKKLDVKWIADFRDPWTNIDFYKDLMLTNWADKKHKKLERKVLQTADRVITVGNNMADEFMLISKKRVYIVPNGFDIADFENMGSDYFGNLHLEPINIERNQANFLQDVSKSAINNNEFKDNLKTKSTEKMSYSEKKTIKKILIITYYWPPSGGAGVQRWLKFVKYLAKHGWDPIVLTVDEKYASYAQIDKTLSSEVNNEIKVFKTKSTEIYNLYKKFTAKKEIPYGGFANEKKTSITGKISKFIRGNFFIPDPRKGWNKYAFKEAVKIIDKYNIENIITTSPPHSTQLIGLKLKMKYNLNWIADFRDPWTDIYYYNELYHLPLAKTIDKNYEKKVLINADKILTVSNEIRKSLLKKVNINSEKVEVIPNGYDSSDFTKIPNPNEDKFVITYTGTMSESYDISGFISAMLKLGDEYQRKIKIRFVGKTYLPTIKIIKKTLPLIELSLIGYVSHKKSIEYLLSSNIQLLIIPKVKDNKGIITGKFFEYLASQKQILALGPKNGDLDKIIRETKSGILVDYNDAELMSKWIKKHIDNPVEYRNVQHEKYSRKELTNRIIEIIENIQ